MLEKCLVVDDHEMIRETIAIMAKSQGFNECVTAIDGADAMSKLYHERPSFIITDLQMEPIDGLEMLRLIRSGRYGLPHDIPIIILTRNNLSWQDGDARQNPPDVHAGNPPPLLFERVKALDRLKRKR